MWIFLPQLKYPIQERWDPKLHILCRTLGICKSISRAITFLLFDLGCVLLILEEYLPIKFLGVPPMTSRIKGKRMLSVNDKILKKVQCWIIKFLPGGRAQANSVRFFCLQLYWSSLFILPQKVIKVIEENLTVFVYSSISEFRRLLTQKLVWYKCV